MGAVMPSDGLPLVSGYRPHALHTGERHWPLTNCYVDLWVEMLHAQGFDPVAALGFTVTQDFEGDQFTFFKFPAEDLEILYGLAVQELAIYDSVEAHLREQARRDVLVLVEVDGYHLPDTRGLTYRTEHGKTTIGVRAIDPAARSLDYFHNGGLYTLDGADYDGLFAPQADPNILPPYTEFVIRRGQALQGADLLAASLARFRLHLARRPRGNPVAAYRTRFPAQLEALFIRPPAFFHQYAFNLPRQLGANFEMLGDYLGWLAAQGAGDFSAARSACTQIAEQAKVLQFRLARLQARKRVDACADVFDLLEPAYAVVMAGITDRFA